MRIEKHFQITLSHKFPTGDIASMQLSTSREMDDLLDNAPDEEIAKFSDNLAKIVYDETMNDLKSIIKKDAVAKEIMLGIKHAIKDQKTTREAEEILETA
jgi:hypothetical protein